MDKLNWQTAKPEEIIRALIKYVLQLPITMLKKGDYAYLAYNEYAPVQKEIWRVVVDGHDRVFNPLVDIADAFMLVGHVSKREDVIAFELYYDKRNWCASYTIKLTPDGIGDIERGAATKLEAICKASLAVYGALEEEP